MCGWPRLRGELLLRLWQKDRKDHYCDEPLGRKASKPRRASKMIDDQAGKCRTERGADAHYRAEHSLGKIEPYWGSWGVVLSGRIGGLGCYGNRSERVDRSSRIGILPLAFSLDPAGPLAWT